MRHLRGLVPDAGWTQQVARNATLEDTGYLKGCRYVLHDRDKKFCAEFRDTLAVGGVECVALPARSPNLNCYAERWVRSVKEDSRFVRPEDESAARFTEVRLWSVHQAIHDLLTEKAAAPGQAEISSGR